MVTTFQAKVIQGSTAALIYLPRKAAIKEQLKRGDIVDVTINNTGASIPVRIYRKPDGTPPQARETHVLNENEKVIEAEEFLESTSGENAKRDGGA